MCSHSCKIPMYLKLMKINSIFLCKNLGLLHKYPTSNTGLKWTVLETRKINTLGTIFPVLQN